MCYYWIGSLAQCPDCTTSANRPVVFFYLRHTDAIRSPHRDACPCDVEWEWNIDLHHHQHYIRYCGQCRINRRDAFQLSVWDTWIHSDQQEDYPRFVNLDNLPRFRSAALAERRPPGEETEADAGRSRTASPVSGGIVEGGLNLVHQRLPPIPTEFQGIGGYAGLDGVWHRHDSGQNTLNPDQDEAELNNAGEEEDDEEEVEEDDTSDEGDAYSDADETEMELEEDEYVGRF
jgi:hypothetical protein